MTIISDIDITVPIQYAPLFDDNVKDIDENSGRVTAKTTSNNICAISLMRRSPKNNIWYCRAEKTDIRDTIFSSFVSTIIQMGLEREFEWSVSPFQVRHKLTGAKCYFWGINGKTADDVTATKSFQPQGNTLALCILDEADEVKHPNHIDAWVSTAVRYLLPYGKMVYAHNPPMTRSHWSVKYFDDLVRHGATRIYCTWEDIKDLLNPRAIEDIRRKEKNDPEGYRYWYLGEPVSFKGMVYPQFKRDTHIVSIWGLLGGGDRVIRLVIGLDEGTAFDSTCASALCIMASGLCVCIDCFENDPVVNGQQSPSQQSQALQQWLCGLLEQFPFLKQVPRHWVFECAEGGQMLKLQFETDTNEDCQLVTQKSIMGDIIRVRNMLAEKILVFSLDGDVGTEQLVQDIENYIFDEKTNSVKKGQRDDTIDSLEYGTKLYYNAPIRNIF